MEAATPFESPVEFEIVKMRAEIRELRQLNNALATDNDSLCRMADHLREENIRFRYKSRAHKQTIRQMQNALELYRAKHRGCCIIEIT